MKVTVLVTTYNHAAFIEQAVASVLEQRAPFDWEVLIGDDRSTDGTREIVQAAQRRHPDRVRVLLPRRNLGGHGNGIFERMMLEARGQYIALLDGDDYWTEPTKLHSQVEYLDAHPDFSICCHAAWNLYPDGRLTPYAENFEYEKGQLRYRLEDIMFQNFLPTCSLVYRNGLVLGLPRNFRRMPSGDWLLNVLHAEHGDIAYLPGVWSVRRVHPGGVISMKPAIDKIRFNIRCVEIIDRQLKRRHTTEAKQRIAAFHRQLVDLFAAEKRWLRAGYHAWQCVRAAPAGSPYSRRLLMRVIRAGFTSSGRPSTS